MKNYNEIKTFEDACKIQGIDPKKVLPNFSNYPEGDREALLAHAKLVIIVRASNKLANDGKEWIPDFNNYKERKYEPWFDLEVSGSSAFRFGDYGLWASASLVGSRLCFINRDVCKYVANQFIDLYESYFK